MNRRNFLLCSMGAAALALAPKLSTLPAEKPFPHGWVVTEEIIEPGLVGEDVAQRFTRELKRSMMQTREIMARNVLTKVFPDEYTYKTYGTARYLDG